MKPTDAVLAHVNGQLGKYELYRALLAHADWRVPTPANTSLPTILVTDAAMTAAIWAFSTEAAYQAACATHHAAAIGPVSHVTRLDEVLSLEDPRVTRLTLDPASPIAFHVQTDELAVLRRLARGIAAERAIAARDWSKVLAYERFAVPYFGVLGQGHNLITLPSERGKMLAAFTAADAIDAFLEAGSDENRALVKFALIDGEQLFGVVHQIAQGVLMNPMGPKTFGFDLDICRDVMAAKK